jgi:hypothetical protein
MKLQTLHSILSDKFSDRCGETLVKRGRYALQDSLSGHEIPDSITPFRSMRPGQRVHMTMVFYSDAETNNLCPRCKTPSESDSGREAQW